MQGEFPTTAIHERLLEQEYTDTPYADFTTYVSPDGSIKLAVKPDILLIGNDNDQNVDLPLIIEYAHTQPNAVEHSSIQALLEQVNQSWGLVFMPSLITQIDDTTLNNIPTDIMGILTEQYGFDPDSPPPSWDLMAIGFAGIEPTALTFAYHYFSPQVANENIDRIEANLTDGPIFSLVGLHWEDVMTLQDIQVKDSTVVVVLESLDTGLIGRSITNREYFLFPE